MGMIGSGAQTARFDPSQLTGSDRLMLMGAMMRDIGGNLRGDQSNSIMDMEGLLAQRQMLAMRQQLLGQANGLIGGTYQDQPGPQVAPPQMGKIPTGAGPLDAPSFGAPQVSSGGQPAAYQPPVQTGQVPFTDPRWQKLALSAPQFGLDLGPMMELAKLNQPHITAMPSGEAINDKDAANVGRSFPKLDSGQVLARNAQGAPSGVSLLPGFADATHSASAAQEAGKADFDLVDVPLGNGQSVKLPRSLAAPMLAKAAARFTGAAAPGGAGASPAAAATTGQQPDGAGFGVTPSPAETTLGTKRAENQAGREQIQPKELGAINDLRRTSDLTSQILHQVLGDAPITDPKTGQTTGWRQGGAKPQLNWATTGVAANLKGVYGTPAHDLEQQLEHIRSMTALDELQKMRDNSPTGGAMGRVTDGMIDLLSATRGSIDQGQRGPQLTANLRRQLQQLDKLRTIREQTYQSEYGNVQQPQPIGQRNQAAAPSRAAIEAEARRRGLIK